eukprot:EG_transcript_18822
MEEKLNATNVELAFKLSLETMGCGINWRIDGLWERACALHKNRPIKSTHELGIVFLSFCPRNHLSRFQGAACFDVLYLVVVWSVYKDVWMLKCPEKNCAKQQNILQNGH